MTPETRQSEGVSHQNGLEQAIDQYKQSEYFFALSRNTQVSYNHDLTNFKKNTAKFTILCRLINLLRKMLLIGAIS